ncbi:MAG: sulfatase-like hydrolase/transferase [Thermoanaerobaculia bacterium]|nr:sulfatase-like hydrolase/transferase [Thermoanaerobaculia bacterium]
MTGGTASRGGSSIAPSHRSGSSQRSSDRRVALFGALHGASLGALLISHPVLDLVARHPAFLDAHRLGAGGIAALGVASTLIPSLVGALIGAWLETWRNLPRTVSLWLTFLSPALVVVPTVFLLHPEVRSRLQTPETRQPVDVVHPVPVILLVFDELPLPVLLDEVGALDADQFPHFARLASMSYFFSGARSPYATTLPSVPAILTGRYAQADLQVAQAETCNLFSDLAGTYRLDVEERVTRLARGIHRPAFAHTAPPSPIGVIARDLGILYLHRVLPTSWTRGLPPVDVGWGSFQASHGPSDPTRDPRVARFLDFIDRVGADPDVPTLYFFHSALPHRPWDLGGDLPSQTRVADDLLGQLLERMDETGLLNRALVVVVADHGIGLTPGAGERGDPDRRVVFDEILSVPLFIKLPEQTQGKHHAGYVETVDLLPTVAQVLGFEPSCPPDGRSLFAAKRAWEETTFYLHRGWATRPAAVTRGRPRGL